MHTSRVLLLVLAFTLAACSTAPKATSPTGCVHLSGMACSALLKKLKQEIRPGDTQAQAEATLKKYGLIYKYIPRSESAQKENPSNRAGRITIGIDDGFWPTPRAQGYVVDIPIDKQGLVLGLHVNTLTAP